MRGLAEFIMRGRWQALAVAVLGAGTLLFGWISGAAVALVTLRQGMAAGGWLVLWALLPASLMFYVSGDSGSVLLLLGTFAMAAVLRVTVSLPLAMMTSVIVGVLSGVATLWMSGEVLADIAAVFADVMSQLEANIAAQQSADVTLYRPDAEHIAGMLGMGNAVVAVLSLLLARYWQAMLYNPGGFRVEFHQLRLPPALTLGVSVLALALWSSGVVAGAWAMIMMVPLMFCSFSLLHVRVAATGRGTGWLIGSYLLWLLVDAVKLVFLGLVVIDAVVDFRSRWQATRPGGRR